MLTAAEVRGKRFAVTKFREGYAQSEVDAFLSRVASTLEQSGTRGAVAPDEVVQVRFPPTRFGSGYDQDEVDDFLDEVVAALQAVHGTSSATSSDLPGSDARPGDAPEVLRPPAPGVLRTLRVAAFALFATAVILLVLDLAPFRGVVWILVVSLISGIAVQFLISRATKVSRDGTDPGRSGS